MIKRAMSLMVALALVSVLLPLTGRPLSSEASGISVGRVHQSFNPLSGKIFVLVIGSDARRGNPDAVRADAIHIVGVNTKTMHAGVLNFPRDSYVNVPGHGSMKMNESLYAGGPKLLAKTLEGVTGIRLDYWVMTGFQGFERIVDDLGGIRMRVPQAIHDSWSGADLEKGLQVLGPGESLAFNRSRHALPNGDIDRSTNQGLFLLTLLDNLHDDVEDNPASLLRWLATTRENTRLDVSPEEVFRLGILATQMPPENVSSKTVPVKLGSSGAASVVFISPSARSLYARFERTASLK